MKKLYELTKDELKKLYNTNTEFRQKVWLDIYDDHQSWQNDRYNEYFEENPRGFKYNGHYNSFYYTLTDAEQFVASLRETACDYFFDTEAQKHFDKMFDLYNKWQNMTLEEQDENEEVYLKLETEAKYILKCIEDDLKSFEDITEDDEENTLQEIINGEIYSDWETDGEIVYEKNIKIEPEMVSWEIHILQ